MDSTLVLLLRRAGSFALALAILTPAPLLTRGDSAPPSDGWIYLRGGQVPAFSETVVEVLAVGDVMTGRALAETAHPFEHVSDVLRAADVTIGNLEGIVSSAPSGDESRVLLLPQRTPAMLAEAGFDLLSVANNHALDGGPEGLEETRRGLLQAGIQPLAGARTVVRQIHELSLAFIAWNDLGFGEVEELLRAVGQARKKADVVIVIVHWGQEYSRNPILPQRELASALIQAGVDIVAGSHPHVVQEVSIVRPRAEEARPGLVAYSLGNFMFDQGWDDTSQGLALRLLFDRDGLRAVQALPLWTAGRPRWMDSADRAALLGRVIAPERVGFSCSEESCRPVPVPDGERSGAFWSGAVDLTGDGLKEIVRRRGEAAEVFEGGRVVWSSPADWRVHDLALGDPNEDGRSEILLAIEKTGLAGETTSHPFVVGFRGGMYRVLWGGSAVHAPLVEVELGDVDGDGTEELVAIEAPPDDSGRYVTVWRWHGWGFSLIWRSVTGNYRDLIILPEADGSPARFSLVDGAW